MAYYLRHYFDPDFSHEKLTPQSLTDGDVSQHYLGYVRNVVAGQVLAELIDLEKNPEFTGFDSRYVYNERVFPCGPNCSPHPTDPNRIIATANGYCFYHDGLITVKKMLNVRKDVDFHTGNILFVGDIVAHRSVRTGFTIQGNKVLIKGTVDGAIVKAKSDIVCERGIKGVGTGVLESNGNMKLQFCENMRLYAKGNIEIDGSCLHSHIVVGGSLLVKGRLQGGVVCANNIVYVTDQIGGGQDTSTKIIMGYEPFAFQHVQEVEAEISELHTKLEKYNRMTEKKPGMAEALALPIKVITRKLKILHAERNSIWSTFHTNEEAAAAKCKVICPGKIKPGLELSIGRAYTTVNDFYNNVEFFYQDFDVVQQDLK